MKNLSLIGFALASVLVLGGERAFAHSVQTDYLLSEDNGLALDVTFSSGEPLADAPVKIYSPDNLSEPWMEGKTDENGQFDFLPDQALEGEWTVEIGEYSHADILSVPVEEAGIQIEDISQDPSANDRLLAQDSLTLKTLPAQAATLTPSQSNSFGYGELMILGLSVLGGGVVLRRAMK